MAGPIIALLLSIQAPVLVPDAPPVPRPGKVPPGMVYDPITDSVIPIRGWRPDDQPGLPAAGTRHQYNRVGGKVGEVPVRR